MEGPSDAPLHDVIIEVTNRIKEKVNSLPSKRSRHRICKVQDNLRKVNEMTYEPVVVAIGPYHHGKAHLRKMEDLKLRCFQSLLNRTNEANANSYDANRYAKVIREIAKKARDFYEDPIDLDINDFVMMMVVDGCFIVELFIGFYKKIGQQNNIKQLEQDAVDVILGRDWLLRSIQRDLLLCENQMPYFVLSKLFEMAVPEEENYPPFLAMLFFSVSLEDRAMMMDWSSIIKDEGFETDFDHLLSMVYCYWCPSFATKKHSDGFLNIPQRRIFKFSATELQEAGIKFMKNKSFEKNESLGGPVLVVTNRGGLESMTPPSEIKFSNGVLKIPRLTIDQNTESLFRNLLAYEQQSLSFPFSYIADYIGFMDILIDTEKDVQILRHSDIIQNGLGDDEAVCKMFNHFCKNLVLSRDSCYSQVLTSIHDHCKQRRHRWMANLRHNYFNSPWALISFIAAAFVILLTAAQTVYAVLSYYNIYI
ncbi:hypothetical protein L1049_024436 [Liquidambar formosana]|uniref:Uncharacterized protein n=1 Tax=Liquidambar formosana TaxID=63359 RepID=A0AAP0WZL3_LIQFO